MLKKLRDYLLNRTRAKNKSEQDRILGFFCGGIHKRIDENRELMELLEEKAPKLLSDHYWIRGWIHSNDEFFVALEQAFPVEKYYSTHLKNGGIRPWPPESKQTEAEHKLDRARRREYHQGETCRLLGQIQQDMQSLIIQMAQTARDAGSDAATPRATHTTTNQ